MNYLGHYINGAFEFSEKVNLKKISGKAHISPADFDDEIFRWPATDSCPLDFVFEKGKKAYLPWARLSMDERIRKLLPLKQIIKKGWPELSQIISRETGKPLWESEGEVKSLIGKIGFVLEGRD